MRRTLLSVILCGLGGCLAVYADEEVPCLIFSGNAGSNYILDLEKFKRITFGDQSMTLTHPDYPENQVELLYSAYHHLVIGSGVPTGIEDVVEDDSGLMYYDRQSRSLKLKGVSDKIYSIEIFDVNGIVVCHKNLGCGERVYLDALEGQIYIAVAKCEDEIKIIKFVK